MKAHEYSKKLCRIVTSATS